MRVFLRLYPFLVLFVVAVPQASAFQTMLQLCNKIRADEKEIVVQIHDVCAFGDDIEIEDPVDDCFCEAVKQGRCSLVDFLLNDKRVAPISNEAIAFALTEVDLNDLETVGLLVQDQRASVSSLDLLFEFAAKWERSHLLQLLLNTRRISDQAVHNAFINAAENGNAQIVNLLLQSGRMEPCQLGEARALAYSSGHADIVNRLDVALRQHLSNLGAPQVVRVFVAILYLSMTYSY